MSALALFLAAAFPENPTIAENLTFIFVGFFFVAVVLLILALATSLVGAISRRVQPKDSETVSSQPSPRDDGVPRDIAAAIAAASFHTLQGRPHRIVSIRPSNSR